MNRVLVSLLLSAMTATNVAFAAQTQPQAPPQISSIPSGESSANTLEVPRQILRTGVVLSSPTLGANAKQLADSIGLSPVLQQINSLKSQVDTTVPATTMEQLSKRQELTEAIQRAVRIIQRTDMEIGFTISEISAERQLYEEVLRTFTADRDKQLALINAASFISNGALWAVCEGLAIPTAKRSKYAISSGITGIIAGLVPSMFSLYTLRAVNGKKRRSEEEPNMLAKVFGYPANPEIDYPQSVWDFLNQVPANSPGSKPRIEQLIDHWILDANIPSFTDRRSRSQLDIITAGAAHRSGLTIGSLQTRVVMLDHLESEIIKMRRLLLELTMVVDGDKQL